ncbi:Fe-S cluster assembly ATPase SufC [Clostridium sp. D2Q-11]|uniref:Fe-S cluster assembly ATPase SufC n=1 Tax=Anaeromonas frigoriresistens TaxID=2683708 RepID=A0A942UTT6_9FIRM|nr:Fe-S cluster assembly ATPase SufC [Anaeromonas frigoriresistens]MBS4537310.1 Fe-S cluster assembly ATPase SufC [Anaeromonas frigoriresistens]
MSKKLLDIKNLHSRVEEAEILKGLNLQINKGEIHIIMGPNGAGKSTLANVLMGHPKHEITDGEIIFNDENINDLEVNKRAKEGLFLSFQYPEEIPGVTVENFLRTAKSSITEEKQGIFAFRKILKEKMELLEMDESYATRYLNQGFSGGEKKKNEILQMAVLEPKLAILDETDSGLDIDAIRIVSKGVKTYSSDDNAILVITHYNKILDYLEPDFVHILVDGKIVKTGGVELAHEIEEKGYEEFKRELS